ncbi:RecX family transcriptional regulator, partial [Salmonella enterica]|uniref:regulatory protein RecX n=1 Tax=Salmonella enterica TaxID=28901 RepID=UPI0022B74882
WGKIRIVNELKARHITSTNINLALSGISTEEYIETFEKLCQKCWDSIHENNPLKKRKKFCDYILRRGYESNMVYEKVKELEAEAK